MALAETARLVVDLSLKGNFARDLRKTSGALGQFEARMDRTESRAFRAGQQIGTGIKRGAALAAVGVGILALNVERGLQSLIDLEAQTDITNAAIKSTGGIAGITATEVRKMAEEFESVNAPVRRRGHPVGREHPARVHQYPQEGVQADPPGRPRPEHHDGWPGWAGHSRPRSARHGAERSDQGLGRSPRGGVAFTEEQTKRIKELQKEGKLLEAQAIILAESTSSSAARRGVRGRDRTQGRPSSTTPSRTCRRTLAAGLLPVVSNIADALSDLFADPAIQKGVKDFGAGPRQDAVARVPSSRASPTSENFAVAVAPAFKAAAGAVGTLIGAFNKLPPDLRNLLVGAFAVNKLTGGLVTNIAGGLASAIGGALKTIVAGNVTVIGKNVIGGGGLPGGGPKGGLPGIPPVAAGAAGLAGPLIIAGIAPIAASQLAIALAGGPEGVRRRDEAGRALTAAARGLDAAAIRLGTAPQRGSRGERPPQQSPDARDRAITAKLQNIADVFVRANADRAGERGARGRAPGASTETQNNIRELAAKLTPIDANTGTIIPGAINRLQASSLSSIQALGTNVTTTGQATKQATTTGSQLVSSTTRSSSYANAAIVAGATRASASAIIGAIYAARPIINTTHVTRNTTIQQRYGPGNGSAGNNGPGASGV